MRKILSRLFSITILLIFVANSIVEIRLADVSLWIEVVNELGEEEESKKETSEKNGKAETDEDDKIFENNHLTLHALNINSSNKTRSAHHYADNLSHFSCELESPPPEKIFL